MSVREISRAEEPDREGGSTPLVVIDRELFGGIEVLLEARLGEAKLTLDAIMRLQPGTTVALETGLVDMVDLYLNGLPVARGEIVAVGEKFGVRLVEVAAEV